MQQLILTLSNQLPLSKEHIKNIIKLLEEGAKNIVEHKIKNGAFQTKDKLLKVKGAGKRAYEQAAGFIRIKDAKDILDNTGVHPESYGVARKLFQRDLKVINITAVAKELGVGEATLRDIVDELQKPGFDPRQEQPFIPFKEGITDIEQLREGNRVSVLLGILLSLVHLWILASKMME